MKITKLTHACLLIEIDQKQLLIDPGVFTEDIPELPNLSAVIITHLHPDHINDVWLAQLQTNMPDVPLYAAQDVAEAYSQIKFEVITDAQTIQVDSFSVDYWLTKHELVHKSLPQPQNLAIMVNDDLFYPGDSFLKPDKPVKTLACPASAPWLKISEVIDYIHSIKAGLVFPTHDALLSDAGNSVYHRMMKKACEDAGSRWHYAIPGEQIEIAS